LLHQALNAGLLLEANGEELVWKAPLRKPPSVDLLKRLGAYKEELLALLAHRQRAVRLVERWFVQAERLWRAGTRLEGEPDCRLQERVTAAFWAAVEDGDFSGLRKALAAHLVQMQAARAA
jgi:DNA-binding GntR family transcriptional regulator